MSVAVSMYQYHFISITKVFCSKDLKVLWTKRPLLSSIDNNIIIHSNILWYCELIL